MVTQDKSQYVVVEVCDEYLFGGAKTGSLGQVTTGEKKLKYHEQEKPQWH